MDDTTLMNGNQLRLEGLGRKVEGSNSSAGKIFFSKNLGLSELNSSGLIARLFHVRDAIFVQSSVVQCGNVPVFK